MSISTDVENAYQFCDGLARQRARNFYPAFRFLPRERRLALSAFYSYCSLSDDTVDDPESVTKADKRIQLDAWRARLDQMFEGQTEGPVFMALADAVKKYDLPRQPLFDLLDGVEMDLAVTRYETFDDLLVYCRRVASSVGIISAKIFGCTHAGGEIYADHLGIAFQLTNIMRDVAEDYRMGRIYLPLEDIDKFGYSEDDLATAQFNDEFRSLMEFQYLRALKYYNAAQTNLAEGQAKTLFTAELMKSVYLRLLREIKRCEYDVFSGRIRVPSYRMAFGLGVTFLRHLMRR